MIRYVSYSQSIDTTDISYDTEPYREHLENSSIPSLIICVCVMSWKIVWKSPQICFPRPTKFKLIKNMAANDADDTQR